MIEASCHCGAVRFAIPRPPETLNDCHCTICRRYGVLWGYYTRKDVRFEMQDGATDIYVRVNGDLEFHRCRNCGCVTHWEAVNKVYERIGINARLLAPEVLTAIPIHQTDGPSG